MIEKDEENNISRKLHKSTTVGGRLIYPACAECDLGDSGRSVVNASHVRRLHPAAALLQQQLACTHERG